MRYYKFNRDRSLNSLQKHIKSCKKLGYLAKRNNLHMLDSFHFENQTWGALHKAWKGYVIAKNKDEPDRMKYDNAVLKLKKIIPKAFDESLRSRSWIILLVLDYLLIRKRKLDALKLADLLRGGYIAECYIHGKNCAWFSVCEISSPRYANAA